MKFNFVKFLPKFSKIALATNKFENSSDLTQQIEEQVGDRGALEKFFENIKCIK